MYQAGNRQKDQRRRRRRWLVAALLFVILIVALIIFILHQLKPQTTIKQSRAVITKTADDHKTKHYDEPDFGIDLPADWAVAPSPVGPYQLYRWQSPSGQLIEVYENVIPVNYAVNRVVIVEAQVDRLQLSGTASDNCSQFTRGTQAAPGQVGAPAKWLDVSFLCDQFNKERDTLGTSSTDGVNTVILRQPTTGATHKFFFTFSNRSTNPDYTPFYDALRSFKLQ